MTENFLKVAFLAYSYEDGKTALRGLDFGLGSGETAVVMGPNGAGKSTLLWILTGVFKKFSGEVSIGGKMMADYDEKSLVKTVNLVFQNPENQMFCDTLEEELSFALRNLGMPPDEIKKRVEEAAENLGLAELLGSEPAHLSFGQKKRAALASILAIGPELLLLDEPSANLDYAGKRRLVETLNGYEKAKLIVTQDVHFALSVSKRVIYLEDGSIKYDGMFDSPSFFSACPGVRDEILDYRARSAGVLLELK